MRRALPAAAVPLAVIVSCPPAGAFVRERVEKDCEPDCAEIRWHGTNCVPIKIYLGGFSAMTPDEVAKSVAAAAHTWSPSRVDCPTMGSVTRPYLEIIPSMAAPGASTPPVAEDRRNVLVFRTTGWLERDFPAQAVAVTTVITKKDGRILDADMEINVEFFPDWANLDPGSNPGSNGLALPFDLQNVTTHEFGHLIGLGHTCFEPGGSDPVRPVDHNGDPVPDCDAASDEVRATVMFAVVDAGETHKRVLSADDMAGVCAIYPAADDPKLCSFDVPDDGCGCGVGSGGAGGVALALLALWTARRSR